MLRDCLPSVRLIVTRTTQRAGPGGGGAGNSVFFLAGALSRHNQGSWVVLQVIFWVNPVLLIRSDLDLIILLFVLEDHSHRRGGIAFDVPAKSLISVRGFESALLRVDIAA